MRQAIQCLHAEEEHRQHRKSSMGGWVIRRDEADMGS